MTWPAPQPGLVVRFSYLWKREADAGREEGGSFSRVSTRDIATWLGISRSLVSLILRNEIWVTA